MGFDLETNGLLRQNVAAVEAPGEPVSPFGRVGLAPEPACRCGAGPHAERADRCAAGHVVRGNGLALVVGAYSAAFWAAEAEARRVTREAVLNDQGHSVGGAPRALVLTAEGIAQAEILRDAAYQHLVRDGGPMAASGRVRRAYTVWLTASDRLERHLRLVGLRRVPKPAPTSFADAIMEAPEVSDD